MSDRELADTIAEWLIVGLFVLSLLVGFCEIIAGLPETFPLLIRAIIGLVGMFYIFKAYGCFFDALIYRDKKEKATHEFTNGCKRVLLGVFLLAIASCIHTNEKPSSYQSSSTYVHEDYSRPTREYSAHKQDYHPIELPKSYKPVEVTAPKLESLPPPLKTDLPRYTPPLVDNIPLPDKSLTQVPVPLSDSEREALIKALLAAHESDLKQREAKLEAARKEPDAQSEPLRNNHAVEPTPTAPEPYYYPEPAPYYYSEPEPYYSESTPYDAYIALEQGRSRTLAPKLFSPRPIMPLPAVAP